MFSYEDHLKKLDELIRSGRLDEAKRQLNSTVKSKIPRRYILGYANTARRLVLTPVALKLLNPIIRPPTGGSSASPAESAEYALNLMRAGARTEARDLLQTISPEQAPQAPLYKGFLEILEWNYKSAIPHFRDYIANKPGKYDTIIAKANLLSALVVENVKPEVSTLLAELREATKEAGFENIRASLMELEAQFAFTNGDDERALDCLNESKKTFSDEKSVHGLLVQKWFALVALRKDPKNRSNLDKVRQVRKNAAEIKHWETIRECDRAIAIAKQDENLCNHVYFGTPYESYRQRFLKELPPGFQLPRKYTWQLGTSPATLQSTIDLISLHENKNHFRLPHGNALHRLLLSLCVDFYRPQLLAVLHSAVYPGDYFNPATSPARVHRLIHRLREHFDDAKIAVDFDVDNSCVKMTSDKNAAVVITRQSSSAKREAILLEIVNERFASNWFTRTEAETALKLSRGVLHRWFSWAVTEQRLELQGKGPARKYRLKAA